MTKAKPQRAAAVVDDDKDDAPITRTLTSVAATGVNKPRGSMNSAFDTGVPLPRKKGERLPPLDLSTIVIESGIPLPLSKRVATGESPYQKLLAEMQVGQSVQLEHAYAKSLVSAAKKARVKLAVRQLTETHSGCWRLA